MQAKINPNNASLHTRSLATVQSLIEFAKVCRSSYALLGVLLPAYYDSKLWLLTSSELCITK